MLRHTFILIAVLGSGAAFAACGGSDGSTDSDETAASGSQSTPAPAQTSTEFVAQADALCRKAKGDYLELARQGGAALAAGKSQAGPLGRVADLFRSLESDLAHLTPPADLVSTYDSYLKSKQEQVATADGVAQAAADAPPREVSPEMKGFFEDISQQGDDSAKLAAALGFKICA